MSVMFEEEVSKLRLKIVTLQDQLGSAEQEHRRLAQALSESKQQAETKDHALREAKAEVQTAQDRAATAQRAVERLASLEASVSEAENRASRLSEQNERLKRDLSNEQVEKGRALESLSNAKARLTLLESQVMPLEKLVAALKASQAASETIKEQLQELQLGA